MTKQKIISEIATCLTMLEQEPENIMKNIPALKEEKDVYPFLVGYTKAYLEYILEECEQK